MSSENSDLPPPAFHFEGQVVVTNARAAEIFDVETREVTQNIKTNPEKFDHFSRRYAFELTPDQTESLRSAGLIPKRGRGGSSAMPWLLTRKGVFRLATIMKSERAIQAVDVFVDVFDEIAEQITRGQTTVEISAPSRIVALPEEAAETQGFRRRLRARLEDLMDTVISRDDHLTVRDALAETSRDTYNAMTAFLEKGALQNEKTAAETAEVLERVRDLFERRMSDLQDAALERERAAVQIAKEKIELIQTSLELSKQLEPSAMVEITSTFSEALPKPE